MVRYCPWVEGSSRPKLTGRVSNDEKSIWATLSLKRTGDAGMAFRLIKKNRSSVPPATMI